MKNENSKDQTPFKTVVVGVDFSEYSKVVVRQAGKLATEFDAQLVLVNAADETWPGVGVAGLYIPPVELNDLKKSVKKFYHRHTGRAFKVEVGRGMPWNVVLRTAEAVPEPLIVVGSQGSGAVSRFILGSQAEAIALRSPFPVWVHRGSKIVPFKRLLVPTDLSASSKKHIAQLHKWSDGLKMSLNYLHVRPEVVPLLNYPQYKEMVDRMQKNLKQTLSRFRREGNDLPIITVAANDASTKISRVGKKYDVIAMNPHSRSGLLNKFGRITSRVIRLAENPVLVMKT